MAPVSGATLASHRGAAWQLYLAGFGIPGWPATAWRGELANVRGELASARRELGVEVAELRSVLTELDREVGADDEALRSGLDELGGRVERIEGMVTVLWRAPAGSTRTRVSSLPQIPDP